MIGKGFSAMRYAKDHHTGYLFDPWVQLGPRRREIVETGWPGLFRKYLFDRLPVDRLGRHFREFRGRPTKELYVMLGGMVLQQMFDLTDDEARDALLFRVDWQYALDIADPSDALVYVSDRTWRSYRQFCIAEGIDAVVFGELTDTLRQMFGVDTAAQRLDSTHLLSNMRKLGRVGLFVATIRKFLRKLLRIRKEAGASLAPELTSRYLAKDSEACFSRVKPSESAKTLQQVAEDLALLVEHFRVEDTIRKWPEFQLLERVLREQCDVTGSGAEAKVTVKPPQTVSPDCLQNPSDPDASYDAHKGSGYQAQLMETYQATEERDPKIPNLITHVEVEPAHNQDADALQSAIDATTERKCCPAQLLCDTLYGGDENVEEAKSKGVEVIAPVGGHTTPKSLTLGHFTSNPTTFVITRCPEGHAPERVEYNKKNRLQATFSRETCQACPRLSDCPVRLGKKDASLYYDAAKLRCAFRRVHEQTQDFMSKYRWRSGIEGTNSHLKRDTGACRLRIRGLGAVRFAIILKALAVNIMRCVRALKARLAGGLPLLGTPKPLLTIVPSPLRILCSMRVSNKLPQNHLLRVHTCFLLCA